MKKKSDKEIVEEILKVSEKARNSDTYGTALVWYNHNREKVIDTPQGKAVLITDYVDILFREDTFKRWRAWFNSAKGGKLYLATDPEIIKNRQKGQKKMLGKLGYNVE